MFSGSKQNSENSTDEIQVSSTKDELIALVPFPCVKAGFTIW